MDYPSTLQTSKGCFSLFKIADNEELFYTGNELITNELTIRATDFDGILIALMPNLFREDKEDDMIHYFDYEGKEILITKAMRS